MGIIAVPITKGKATVNVDTEADIPTDDIFAEVVLQGLKVVLNRGMSKVTKEAYPDEDELKAAAMAIAQSQLAKLRAGDIKTGKKAAGKASGAVMTEARRIAKNIIKDAMKREGIKVSYVDAKDITKAANLYLDGHPEVIEQAKVAIAEREDIAKATPIGLDLSALIPINETKAAKAEATAAKKRKGTKPAAEGQLSAAKAGKVKAKPTARLNA